MLVMCTARLGLIAPALAWPEVALAFENVRPGQSHRPGLGPGLAWPRLWLLYEKIFAVLMYMKSLGVIHILLSLVPFGVASDKEVDSL